MVFARLGFRMGSKTKPRDVEIATKPQFFNKMSSLCDKVAVKLEACEVVTGGFIVFGTISVRHSSLLAQRAVFPVFLKPGISLVFPEVMKISRFSWNSADSSQ